MIPERYAAAAFVRSATTRCRLRRWLGLVPTQDLAADQRHREALARELETLVATRLEHAIDPRSEFVAIIDDLRCIGHALALDVEQPDETIYCCLPRRDLAVWASWSDRDMRTIEVLWQKM